MRKSLRAGVVIGAFLLVLASIQQGFAEPHGDRIRHVLLISVDGMHSLDYANCANGISDQKRWGAVLPQSQGARRARRELFEQFYL